jgi:hypothetical protein
MRGCELDSPASVVNPSEHASGPLGCKKCWEFCDQLSRCYFCQGLCSVELVGVDVLLNLSYLIGQLFVAKYV